MVLLRGRAPVPDDPLSAPDIQKAVQPLLGHRPVDAVVKLSRCLDGSLGVSWVVLAGDVVLLGDRKVGEAAAFRSVPVVAVEAAGIDADGLDSYGTLSLVEGETISVPLTLFDQAAFRDLTVQLEAAAQARREELKSKRAAARSRAEQERKKYKERGERDKQSKRGKRKRDKPRPPAGGRGAVASGSKCPRCGSTLNWQYVRETRAEICPTCGGCLLSTSAAERLARRSGTAHMLKAPRPGTVRCHGCGRPATPRHSYCGSCGAHLGLDCPACGGWMPTLAVASLELDVCQSCSGVWLDSGEASDLAENPRRKASAARNRKKQTSLEEMIEDFVEMLTGGM